MCDEYPIGTYQVDYIGNQTIRFGSVSMCFKENSTICVERGVLEDGTEGKLKTL